MNFKYFILPIISLILSGCQIKRGPMKGKKEVIIIPKENINKKMGLRVYIVQCYSENSLIEINNMESTEFFAKINQLALNFPDEIKIWEVDITENSSILSVIIPNKKRFWGITIFFKFIDNVENKYRYPESMKSVEIVLKDGKFDVWDHNKKYVYANNKQKQWLCLYLNFDSCVGIHNRKNNKIKKYR